MSDAQMSGILDEKTHEGRAAINAGVDLEYEQELTAFWTVRSELSKNEALTVAGGNEGGPDTFPMESRHTLRLTDDNGIAFTLRIAFATEFLSGRAEHGESCTLGMGRRQLEGFFAAVREIETAWRKGAP